MTVYGIHSKFRSLILKVRITCLVKKAKIEVRLNMYLPKYLEKWRKYVGYCLYQ